MKNPNNKDSMYAEYSVCAECGVVTKIHEDTLKVMKLLNLTDKDYWINCDRCREISTLSLLRSINGVK